MKLTDEEKEFMRTLLVCQGYVINDYPISIVESLISKGMLDTYCTGHDKNERFHLSFRGREVWEELKLSDSSTDPNRVWSRRKWSSYFAFEIDRAFHDYWTRFDDSPFSKRVPKLESSTQ